MLDTRFRLLLGMGVSLVFGQLSAQNGIQTLSLQDLTGFKQQAGNWQIVGSVVMDRNVEVAHEAAKEPVSKGKKKKGPEPSVPKAVSYSEGSGILLNQNTASQKDALITTWEHGDIELDLEVMLPKGSNSGIYLQGRYEVQLYDSWGVRNPSFSDIGGIYRNWESDPARSYMGKAPLLNAAKAPGLWQQLKISFRAPRFDVSGKKIANARFNYVELNGVRIHENVEVPQMTGGPIGTSEVSKGPLMIQGDHGPVALRNIRYRLLEDSEVTMSNLSYQVFLGTFDLEKEFRSLKPSKEGTTPLITWEVAGQEDDFAIVFKGTLDIPKADAYKFMLTAPRNGRLNVAGQDVVSTIGNVNQPMRLEKGPVPFELVYFKRDSWFDPRLGLFIQGQNTHPKAFHTFNSLPPGSDAVAPIFINVGNEPKLLRAFLDFEADPARRLTHTIGVGDPGGTHYIYDLKTGNVVTVWRGNFVDATPMWHDRGDGSFRPAGAVQYFFIEPQLSRLATASDAFPVQSNDMRSKGYSLDETGRPVFIYDYQGIQVKDSCRPATDGKSIQRDLQFSSIPEGGGFYYKLAEAAEITQLPDGSFNIGGKYYIVSRLTPFIRESNGLKELVCPISGQSLSYDIIW